MSSASATSRCCSAAPAPGSPARICRWSTRRNGSTNMTAGRGWIALALVVFASWRPWRVLVGAYLSAPSRIAAASRAGDRGIGHSVAVSRALPYLATVVVLVIISRNSDADARQHAGLARTAVRPGSVTAMRTRGRARRRVRASDRVTRMKKREINDEDRFLRSRPRRPPRWRLRGAAPGRRQAQGLLHLCRPGRRRRLYLAARPGPAWQSRRSSATRSRRTFVENVAGRPGCRARHRAPGPQRLQADLHHLVRLHGRRRSRSPAKFPT